MTNRKKQSIMKLSGGIKATEKTPERSEASKSLQELFDDYLKTDNKAQREKMLKEFAARRIEFVEYLRAHPELLAAETQTALIFAALGGKTSELETITDAHGRKTRKCKTRQAAPNIAALERLLNTESAAKVENNLMDMLKECLAEGDEDGV